MTKNNNRGHQTKRCRKQAVKTIRAVRSNELGSFGSFVIATIQRMNGFRVTGR